MTPDEIRNLKPGPELDRAVGIAMEQEPRITWEWWDAEEKASACSYDSEAVAREDLARSLARKPSHYAQWHVGRLERWPAYSSSWAGLGLVVEEMERREWWWDSVTTTKPSPGHVAFFWSGDRSIEVTGSDRFSATAKAALLALAAEKGRTP